MSLSDRSKRSGAVALALALALALTACGDDDGATVRETGSGSGSGSGSHADHSASGTAECVEVEADHTVVEAELRDFAIVLADDEVPTGEVFIDATNAGEHPHEIVVVKGVAPADLPIEDGKVDESALPDGALIGEIEQFDPGADCAGEFDLDAADYTLFCNVVEGDTAHVAEGMIATLTVT